MLVKLRYKEDSFLYEEAEVFFKGIPDVDLLSQGASNEGRFSFDKYALTRKFYTNLNYTHEATIRDFYQDGEDKIIFWKKLT